MKPSIGSCVWPFDFYPFRKVIEPLGCGAVLEEVSHWDQALLDSLVPFLVYSLLPSVDAVPLLVSSSCHHAFHACCCAFPVGWIIYLCNCVENGWDCVILPALGHVLALEYKEETKQNKNSGPLTNCLFYFILFCFLVNSVDQSKTNWYSEGKKKKIHILMGEPANHGTNTKQGEEIAAVIFVNNLKVCVHNVPCPKAALWSSEAQAASTP